MVRTGRPATTDDGSANANAVQDAPIKEAKVQAKGRKVEVAVGEAKVTMTQVEVLTDAAMNAIITQLEGLGLEQGEIEAIIEKRKRSVSKEIEGLVDDLVWDAIEEGGSHHTPYMKLYRRWEMAEEVVKTCEHTKAAEACLAQVENYRSETVAAEIKAGVADGSIILERPVEEEVVEDAPKAKKPASRKGNAKKGKGKSRKQTS